MKQKIRKNTVQPGLTGSTKTRNNKPKTILTAFTTCLFLKEVALSLSQCTGSDKSCCSVFHYCHPPTTLPGSASPSPLWGPTRKGKI